MRPTMFLLALIAAIAGTPLRQAEAAEDLARIMAGVQSGGIEEIDGGVGDDSGETVLKAVAQVEIGPATFLPVAFLDALLPVECPRVGRSEGHPEVQVVWLAVEGPRRLAWLQRFRF